MAQTKNRNMSGPLNILVTGAAGFIGMHVTKRLMAEGHHLVGLDNVNDYYDVSLKEARLDQLAQQNGHFRLAKIDLCDGKAVTACFDETDFDVVINLAAQAGVRYSIENPQAYIDSNIQGFLNILENCRHHETGHLIYASSSSVYGMNQTMPFSESDHTAHPMALYGATKKANEVMAHSYANLYGLPVTGLRFFTVYGPWGRPDMALFLFTKAILAGEPIKVFNNGQMVRDFTYIDDIVESIARLTVKPAAADPAFDPSQPDPSISSVPARIFNIGNGQPTPLMDYIEALETAIGKSAIKEMLPMQPGDVHATSADTSALGDWVGFQPNTSVNEGIQHFVDWYRGFYGV